MVYDYVITLKKPNTRIVDIISQFLYFISLIYFVFFVVISFRIGWTYLLLSVTILVCWVVIILKKRKGNTVYFTSGLGLTGIWWLANADYRNVWMGILYIIAALAEREFKFPKEIAFSEKEIVINSLMKRRYKWNDITNAMIKDDILTIDLKNNKIIQKEIDNGVSVETEKEFNEFCRGRIV